MKPVQSKGVSLTCSVKDIKKALMLCIRAFSYRDSGERPKVNLTGESD
jgi:hypothetical protein